MKFFLDGVEVCSKTGGGAMPHYTHLVVGGSGDAARGFHGHLSDLRIYGDILSQAELSNLAST
jgi:hypothetical protein